MRALAIAAALGALGFVALAALGLAGCGGGDDDGAPVADAAAPDATAIEPGFPADYAASYTEVRDCRRSGDHDLNHIRVLTDAAATGPYDDRVTPFPDGAVVLKEEYEFGDDTCAGPIVQWTVMVKDAAFATGLGWRWQRVDAERNVLEVDTPRCIGCHEACTDVGYDGTCAEP